MTGQRFYSRITDPHDSTTERSTESSEWTNERGKPNKHLNDRVSSSLNYKHKGGLKDVKVRNFGNAFPFLQWHNQEVTFSVS